MRMRTDRVNAIALRAMSLARARPRRARLRRWLRASLIGKIEGGDTAAFEGDGIRRDAAQPSLWKHR